MLARKLIFYLVRIKIGSSVFEIEDTVDISQKSTKLSCKIFCCLANNVASMTKIKYWYENPFFLEVDVGRLRPAAMQYL